MRSGRRCSATSTAADFGLDGVGHEYATSWLLVRFGRPGVAYYTVEPDGLRVVATLAEGEDGTPVRVEALLAAGQSVVISSPREAGAPASRVEIARTGDQVQVSEVALTD
jgi:hypothetical protein